MPLINRLASQPANFGLGGCDDHSGPSKTIENDIENKLIKPVFAGCCWITLAAALAHSNPSDKADELCLKSTRISFCILWGAGTPGLVPEVA